MNQAVVTPYMAVSTFGQFLQEEMHKRALSMREFADLVGVAHTTISKFTSHVDKSVGYPSVEFLLKLAHATHTDICYLMALIDPSVPRTTSVSPDAMITSQRIEQLPDEIRGIVDDIIIKHAKQSD